MRRRICTHACPYSPITTAQQCPAGCATCKFDLPLAKRAGRVHVIWGHSGLNVCFATAASCRALAPTKSPRSWGLKPCIGGSPGTYTTSMLSQPGFAWACRAVCPASRPEALPFCTELGPWICEDTCVCDDNCNVASLKKCWHQVWLCDFWIGGRGVMGQA